MSDGEYNKVVEVATFSGAIAFVVTVVKHVIEKNYGSWFNFVATLFAAILVAIIIGWLLDNTTFSIVTKAGIIGVCAFISRDILEVVKKLKENLVADPRGFIKEVFDLIRGR